MPRRASRQPADDPNKQVQIVTRIPAWLFNRIHEKAENDKTTIGFEAARLIAEAENLREVYGRRTVNKAQMLAATFAKAANLAEEISDPAPYNAFVGWLIGELWKRRPRVAGNDHIDRIAMAEALINKLGLDEPAEVPAALKKIVTESAL
jgi:hypothetical protein